MPCLNVPRNDQHGNCGIQQSIDDLRKQYLLFARIKIGRAAAIGDNQRIGKA
jgi:hypothetical protein